MVGSGDEKRRAAAAALAHLLLPPYFLIVIDNLRLPYDHLSGCNLSYKSFLPVYSCLHSRKFIFKLFGFEINLNDRYAIVKSSRNIH